jgi:hypothetical protein
LLENLNAKKRNTDPLVGGKDGPLEVVIERTKYVFLSREHNAEISHYMKTAEKFFFLKCQIETACTKEFR